MPKASQQPGTAAEPTCLLIADISGYTRYLAGVELDHAQDILADLIGTVVRALRPRFKLSRVEGDAAFMYTPVERIDGTGLLDMAEGCYFAFRRRLLSIQQATTCTCNACILIPTLDLKVAVHHGEVIRYRVAGHEELLGTAAIVIHRMMKNTIGEALGTTAYAFFTDACLDDTHLDPARLGMKHHIEDYDVGQVAGWVHDLVGAWQMEQERTKVRVTPEEALWQTSLYIPSPPTVVFDYVTSPQLRMKWSAEPIELTESSHAGRRGVGTTNHCVHGEDAVTEKVLDWQPPHYWTLETSMEGVTPFIETNEIEEAEGGSMVHVRVKARRRKEEQAVSDFLPMYETMMAAAIEGLRQHLEALPAESDLYLSGAEREGFEPSREL